jgi:hypothetical protein
LDVCKVLALFATNNGASPVPFAIQILERTAPRSQAKWKTVSVARRYSVAERLLASARMDRLHVAERSRIKIFSGPISKAYALAEG